MINFICDNCGEEYETELTDQEVTDTYEQMEAGGKEIYLVCTDCFQLINKEVLIH